MLRRLRIVRFQERFATRALVLATTDFDARLSVRLPIPNVVNFNFMPDMAAQFVIRHDVSVFRHIHLARLIIVGQEHSRRASVALGDNPEFHALAVVIR